MLAQQVWLAVRPWMQTRAGALPDLSGPGHSWTAREMPLTGTRGTAPLLPLVLDGWRRLLRAQLLGEYRDEPRHVGLGGHLEHVHALQGLVVLLAEDHLALGRLELHALHGRDELLGVGARGFLNRRD